MYMLLNINANSLLGCTTHVHRMKIGNGTDLKHGKQFFGGGGECSEATLKGAEVHQSAELSPGVVLVQEDGQGDSSSEVQQPHVTLLLDAHRLHLRTKLL